MTQKLSTNPYKGTRDFYPEEMRIHKWIFNTMRSAVESFGYEEYNGPMLESFDLYAAKSGNELVHDQLYHFEDRGKRRVALRPEMTPTLARMVAARINALPKPVRWYSTPNLWRYERPQRGRLREHWQLNVDIFSVADRKADVEILSIAVAIMQAFGAGPKECVIYINDRRLVNAFFFDIIGIPQESATNVARAIDRKDKVSIEAFESELAAAGLTPDQITQTQAIFTYTIEDLREKYFEKLEACRIVSALFDDIEKAGIADFCQLNLGIMRGFDYYTGTVFEMFDRHPDNNRALFGGGRYDDLVGLFHKQSLPGVGFGMGDVTIGDFLKTHDLLPQLPPKSTVLVTFVEEETVDYCDAIARQVRQHGINCETYLPVGDKLKKQLRYADARNIPYVILAGSQEKDRGVYTLKTLASGTQEELKSDSLIKLLIKKQTNTAPATDL